MDENIDRDLIDNNISQMTDQSHESWVESSSTSQRRSSVVAVMNHAKSKYPFCIVWTPIPVLTWLVPILGHMGIAMSSGIIRDFAGPYFVSWDNMAFGRPTKYWKLDPFKANGGPEGWDNGVSQASEIYSHRMHNICCDNCHSHVATALYLMQYNNSRSWNMVKLCFLMLIHGKYVNIWAIIKTWLPFIIVVCAVIAIVTLLKVNN